MKYELIVDSGEGTRPDPIKEAIDVLNRQGLHARLVEPITEVKPKLDIQTQVAFNGYAIISEAVEKGCSYGVMRAYKYTETPTREQISEECQKAVMNEICTVLTFTDGEQT